MAFPFPTFTWGHFHFMQPLQAMYLQAMQCSAQAALHCLLAGCSKDIPSLPYTLILCVLSTATIILMLPACQQAFSNLERLLRWKSKNKDRSYRTNSLKLWVIVLCFFLCHVLATSTLLILPFKKKIALRFVTVRPEANLAPIWPNLSAAKLHE